MYINLSGRPEFIRTELQDRIDFDSDGFRIRFITCVVTSIRMFFKTLKYLTFTFKETFFSQINRQVLFRSIKS